MNDRVNRAVDPLARAAAQAKKAVDYQAVKDAPDMRSVSQIEEDIQRVREELTATVDELAGRLSPHSLKEDFKSGVKAKLHAAKEKAHTVVSKAKAGDKKSIGILAGVGAASIFVLIKLVKR